MLEAAGISGVRRFAYPKSADVAPLKEHDADAELRYGWELFMEWLCKYSREELVRKAHQRCRAFSWEAAAARICAACRTVLDGKSFQETCR
jgi:hypothetical protein